MVLFSLPSLRTYRTVVAKVCFTQAGEVLQALVFSFFANQSS